MAFQRQLRLMRLQKLFKATFLNSNLGILYKVIKTELADSELSVTVSAATKNFFKSLLFLSSQKNQEYSSVNVILQDLNCLF